MEGPKPNYALTLTLILEDGTAIKGSNDIDTYFAVYTLPNIGDLVSVGTQHDEILKLNYDLEHMNGATVDAKVKKATW